MLQGTKIVLAALTRRNVSGPRMDDSRQSQNGVQRDTGLGRPIWMVNQSFSHVGSDTSACLLAFDI